MLLAAGYLHPRILFLILMSLTGNFVSQVGLNRGAFDLLFPSFFFPYASSCMHCVTSSSNRICFFAQSACVWPNPSPRSRLLSGCLDNSKQVYKDRWSIISERSSFFRIDLVCGKAEPSTVNVWPWLAIAAKEFDIQLVVSGPLGKGSYSQVVSASFDLESWSTC